MGLGRFSSPQEEMIDIPALILSREWNGMDHVWGEEPGGGGRIPQPVVETGPNQRTPKFVIEGRRPLTVGRPCQPSVEPTGQSESPQ